MIRFALTLVAAAVLLPVAATTAAPAAACYVSQEDIARWAVEDHLRAEDAPAIETLHITLDDEEQVGIAVVAFEKGRRAAAVLGLRLVDGQWRIVGTEGAGA